MFVLEFLMLASEPIMYAKHRKDVYLSIKYVSAWTIHLREANRLPSYIAILKSIRKKHTAQSYIIVIDYC